MRIHSALDDIFVDAGLNGDLPEGLKFQHVDRGDSHKVMAIHPDVGQIGQLSWFKKASPGDHKAGEVDGIEVHPDYQRRGVASALWNYANSIPVKPKPRHSTELTDKGRAWSTSVGRPEDEIDQASRGEW